MEARKLFRWVPHLKFLGCRCQTGRILVLRLVDLVVLLPACMPECLPASRCPGTMLVDIHLTPLRCPLESPSTFKRGARMTQVLCQEPSCWGTMCNDGATKGPRGPSEETCGVKEAFSSFENRPENIYFSAWNQSCNTWKLRPAPDLDLSRYCPAGMASTSNVMLGSSKRPAATCEPRALKMV